MAGLAQRLAGWPVPVVVGLLLVAALAVFAPGQTALPPSDRDEARFVQATKQMLETGNYLDIRFQDDSRYNKPVGIYWLQAAAASAFGGAEAPISAYRIPSWIGAALAVALTAWALLPLTGAPVAVVAALMMGSAVLLHVEARIAKTDAMLLASVLLAQGALARIWLAERSGTATALLFWVAIALGVLLKGPIIALPVVGTLAWVMIAERRLPAQARLRPGLGLGVLVLLVMPWLAAITWVSGGAFWQEAVGVDMMSKVASGMERHGAPPGTHIAVFFATFWPFAVLAPWAAVWLWPRRRERAIGFLLGWLVPTWLVFELVATKLPHYVLIAYPAIAALIALSLDDVAARARPHGALRALMLAVFALPALALTLAGPIGPAVLEQRFVGGAAVLALAAAVLLVMAGRALWHWHLHRFTGFAGAGAVLAYAGLLHFALPSLETVFIAPRLAVDETAWRCGAEGPVALTTFREPSAIFALGTDTILTTGQGAAEALLDGRAVMAFVGDEVMMEFASIIGPRAVALDRINGFNYSNGREVHLTLYALDREPGEPCVP
jgi:4-amino-4-deoxy-L-arabinose transferase-like glycosyltransferase